jgi:hypothetical protein
MLKHYTFDSARYLEGIDSAACLAVEMGLFSTYPSRIASTTKMADFATTQATKN